MFQPISSTSPEIEQGSRAPATVRYRLTKRSSNYQVKRAVNTPFLERLHLAHVLEALVQKQIVADLETSAD